VAQVPEGTYACPIHAKAPELNSWESPENWAKRIRRQRSAQLAAKKREAKKAQ
jgi:hypothetical protein